MKSNLDINRVKIRYPYLHYFNLFKKYGIINVSSIELSYDSGKWYTGFPFHKELVCDYEASLVPIFLEFLFNTFGKDVYFYYNEEMEGFNLPKSKLNYEYSKTYSMFDLISDTFKTHNVDEKYFLIHNGNLNIDANWPYGFTTICSIGHFYLNKYQPKEFNPNKIIEKKFLFLNKIAKTERTYLYKKLKTKNIFDSFYYTYNAINEPQFDESISLEGSKVDTNGGMLPLDYYFETSFCNIVTESEFFSGTKDMHCYKTIFFTEKIAKPLNSFNPFIIVSCQHSLKKLKELGFKTFDKWWDESYDEIENDYERLDKIAEIVTQINKYSLEDCYRIYDEMKDVLVHNAELYQKFTNKEYNLKTLFKEPFNSFNCFWDDK